MSSPVLAASLLPPSLACADLVRPGYANRTLVHVDASFTQSNVKLDSGDYKTVVIAKHGTSSLPSFLPTILPFKPAILNTHGDVGNQTVSSSFASLTTPPPRRNLRKAPTHDASSSLSPPSSFRTPSPPHLFVNPL